MCSITCEIPAQENKEKTIKNTKLIFGCVCRLLLELLLGPREMPPPQA